MHRRTAAALLWGSLLSLPLCAGAQQPAPSCEEQLASLRLEMAIADRATPLQDQALQQAAQQLRKEVAGEWAKANQRAETATKAAAEAKQQLDELKKQHVASSPDVMPPVPSAH